MQRPLFNIVKLNQLVLAVAISLVFASSYSFLAIRKYDAHQTRGNLSAYAQSMWNTINGNFMSSTFNYSVHNYWENQFREINVKNSPILGIHFSPILLTLLPVYAISPHPQSLIIMQAIILAVSSCVIFIIAKKILNNLVVSYIIQLSYLLNLGIISATLSEFNAYPLSVIFSALLIWFSLQKKSFSYFLSLFCLLLVQENAAVPAFFFGTYLLFRKSTFIRGLLTMISSISSLLIITKIIIPQISPFGHYLFESAYGTTLGSSYIEMLVNSLSNPLLLIHTIINRENLLYLGKLLIPILPLALYSPLSLATGIMTLLPNLISNSSLLKSLAMYYEAASTPYLYFSLILGVGYIIRKFKHRYILLVVSFVLILAISVQYKLITNLRFSPHCVWSCRFYSPLDAEKDQVIASIPGGVSVSTQDYLSGQLSSRPELYLFPVYFDRADYVVISKGTEIWPLSLEDQLSYISKLRDSLNHSVYLQTDHFIVFQKNP